MHKRVLFVVDGLSGGGAEMTAIRLAEQMRGTGHDVAIANLRDEQDVPVPKGIELIPAFDTSPRRLRKVGEIGRRARILDEHLSRRTPWDLVISTISQSDRIVARSSLGSAAWYVVATPPSARLLSGRRALKRFRRRRRLRDTYGGRKIVAVSEGVRRDLTRDLDIIPSRIETIYNPFDIDRIRGLAARACALAGREYLVHVGRFDAVKRHDRLLGAFARSSFEGRLVLVGTGTAEQVTRIRELIASMGLSSRVDQLGFQSNPYPFMLHARALVLSSDYEGFGNVLVESLICGTPVVSTDCPYGPAEILFGDLAVGMAELTEESLAAAIDRVVENPPAITEASYDRFEIGAITERYLALADRPGP